MWIFYEIEKCALSMWAFLNCFLSSSSDAYLSSKRHPNLAHRHNKNVLCERAGHGDLGSWPTNMRLYIFRSAFLKAAPSQLEVQWTYSRALFYSMTLFETQCDHHTHKSNQGTWVLKNLTVQLYCMYTSFQDMGQTRFDCISWFYLESWPTIDIGIEICQQDP